MKPLTSRVFFLVVVLLAATVARAQVPNWPKVTPPDVTAAGQGVQLSGADYGNGTFVLATYFGGTAAVPAITPVVFTSPDGTTWARRNLSAPGGRTGAPRFLNGKFLLGITPSTATGTSLNGVILSSSDGIAWTSSASLGATTMAPHDFAFGNGIFAGPISGNPAQIVTSTDGVTWTPRVITTGGSGGNITFFNGKFYATVFGSTSGDGLYSSADGATWARVAGAPANPGLLAATTNTLIVSFFTSSGVSGQAVSADGFTFTNASPGINLQAEAIRVLNGAFVVPASASAASFDLTLARASFDGQTWATIGSTLNQFFASEVAYGNGRYVFVGEFDVFSGTTTISPGGSPGGGGGGGTTAPAISAQPVAQTAGAGGSVTFTVTASGASNTYQWLFNGAVIAGATSASYTLANITAANAGNYSVRVTNSGGTVTSNAATLTVAPATSAGAYLSNLSIRSNAGSGPQTLIVGVSVGGAGTVGAKNILVRGIGPALAAFGVGGALADPRLEVFSGQNSIATNDNWDATTTPVATQTAVGAFALTPGSRDAALIGSNIPAGSYTMQITGGGGASGIALAEVYDLTPAASFTSSTPRLVNVSARTQVGTGGDILITGFNVSGTGQRRLLIRAVGPSLASFGVAGTLADPRLEVFSGQTSVAANDNWDATATPAATQTSVGAFALTAGSRDAVLIVSLSPGSYTAQVSGVGNTTGVALVEIYELP